MTFERVAGAADVPEGTVKVFQAGGRSIALCNLDGTLYALDNLCTHDGGPLGEGTLYDGTVECPRHGARFDVKTGAVKALPAVRPVRTYPVKVDEDEVSVDAG
jgi:3-phenylpropionate/trans-cinnamate dioxygenase ferredoxin subunit